MTLPLEFGDEGIVWGMDARLRRGGGRVVRLTGLTVLLAILQPSLTGLILVDGFAAVKGDGGTTRAV